MRQQGSVPSILIGLLLSGCAAVYETTPDVNDSFGGIPLNGGRTQAITVDPNDRRHIIIATQFGGMWKTTDGGQRWRHVSSLQAVFVRDVQFAPDGRTVIATLARDIQTTNGGGIYVSRDAGNSWSRPDTGVIPSDSRTPQRGGAFGIDFDRDSPRTWYVGTTFGLARSTDNGASWVHSKVSTSENLRSDQMQDAAHAVLALDNGVVLAMLIGGVYRNNGAGGSWTEVRNEDFSFYFPVGFNKMERDRDNSSAIVLKDYSRLYYYEPAANRWTALTLPDGGGSRSPYVRVSAGPVIDLGWLGDFDFSGFTVIWVGQGVRALAAWTTGPASTRGLQPGDWVVHGRGDGIHDDTGDLGVAGDLAVVMMGTDGGVFRPRTSSINSWTSGAPDGSRFNSFQITDLAGTNVSLSGGTTKSTLYFATQDNAIWSSDDNGASWPRSDCAEGFHIEVREQSTGTTPITTGYGKVGCGPSNNMYSDAHLANQRAVPDVDEDADVLDKMSQAFYVAPNHWVRTRGGSDDGTRNPGVYVSDNDGDNWRRRFDVGVTPLGVYRRANTQFSATRASMYLPVRTGAANADGSPRIGLVRLNRLYDDRLDSVGSADIIQLPDSGSLARRATEFDWQVVFGVHPKNAEFLIAPDIVNGLVKMSRDGGDTWETNWYLTLAATQLGRYLLWDQRESRVQLTHISYDPYNDDKILVGTRDAGVICSRDGGVTWRTIKGTEPIRYITGFQFRQDGGVLVSTYGRGLWRIKRSRAACTQGRVWVIELPEPPRELVPWREYRTGQLVLPEPDDDAGEVPSGRDLEGVPILSGTGGGPGAEELILGDDNQLTIVGRGFSYDLGAPLLAYLDGAPEPFLKLGIPSSNGRFALRIQLPADLAPGEHRLELVQHSGEPPIRASIWFRKVHLDEHLGEEAPESQFRDENAWEDALRKVLERDPEYKQKQSLR